jgi:glycosyltransferase involved in cell wall biosynthesis
VEKLGVPIHVFNYETDYYPLWSFPLRLWKVVRFFKELDIDIIHSWHWSSDFSETLAARLAGKKYVYTKKNMSWGNKAWRIKSRLSSHVITINNGMQSLFFKIKSNISYIPVGIDMNYFKPLPKQNNLEGIDLKDKFVIISVANMVPLKGIEVLIEAFLKIDKNKDVRIELLLVGSHRGDYGKKLIHLASGYSNIHFLGKKMDVRPYLAEADVFVIPTISHGEGQGVAPLEAMAMGIPVIASDLAGLKDVMKGYEKNLYQPGNVEELIKRLLAAFYEKNEKVNEELSFPEVFTLKAMINSHQQLYDSINAYSL